MNRPPFPKAGGADPLGGIRARRPNAALDARTAFGSPVEPSGQRDPADGAGGQGAPPVDRSPTTRVAGLDAVRGLAALGVLLFHLDLGPTANGFVGVDVFFVLSGFLITRLLLAELSLKGNIDFRRFYMGRLLRLYPALVAVSAACCLLALVMRTHSKEVIAGAVASIGYVSNFWIYGGHDTVLLQHTWTLALEEQFYLLWPAFLMAAMGAGGRRRAAAGAVLGGVVAVAVGITFVPAAGATYLRASGLVLGVAVAFALHFGRRRWPIVTGQALALACGAALAVVTFLSGTVISQDVFTGGVSPAAVLAAPVVAGVAAFNPAGRWLVNPPLLWLGSRSYALYLWHFPVVSITLHNLPGHLPRPALILLAIVLSFAAAELSARIVEAPFLALKARMGQARRPAAALGTFKA